MKRAFLPLALACLLATAGCSMFSGASDLAARIETTPVGASLLKWVDGFRPAVERIVNKVHVALVIDAGEVKMLCGGASTIDALFHATVLFVQIPSGAVEAERLSFMAVEAVCAAAGKGTLPTGHALAKFWTDTKAAIGEAGLKL